VPDSQRRGLGHGGFFKGDFHRKSGYAEQVAVFDLGLANGLVVKISLARRIQVLNQPFAVIGAVKHGVLTRDGPVGQEDVTVRCSTD
jgi:hypothetical protein